MSSNVFRHKPIAPDEKIGRVEPDGRVYESHFGPDKYVGRVEVDNGRVWEARFGPDKLVGHVGLEDGKCRTARFGPDEYVGHVDGNGRLFRHIPVAVDEYLGRIEPMPGFAQAGAALLLLALPRWEDEQAQSASQAKESTEGQGATDTPDQAA